MENHRHGSALAITDDELIQAIIGGNSSKSFEMLYSRYHKKVMDKCFGFVKNKSVAEELTAEIFSKTFEKLPSFKQLSSFSSWIYSITYNHCIDYLRNKKNLHYPNWNNENKIPEIKDETDEPLEEINYENLLVILEMIHPEEKALILMKYQDELSLVQIGKALRISEDAAKMRLKRARTRVIYLYKQKYLQN